MRAAYAFGLPDWDLTDPSYDAWLARETGYNRLD
jgi:hypothetical protein